ncbi:phosphoesterase [Acinetobacter sp. ANC 3882]|uniref:phosphoesterase n=1 Tax=Acinetobacter sp. ANC 3882 TaxID=2923423 RepID=UPI001F4AA61F|nr:phosphoesterase [Acinetobacter sp. ANC 3882]MCH7314115.1 phosphoesterase [Acinetobacter sp. ANC 3882]
MNNSLYLLSLLFLTLSLPACSPKSEPEFIEVKTFKSIQSPYFIKEFALLKYDKTCFLKTSAVLEDGSEINKSWGFSQGNVFLVDDNTPKSPSVDTNQTPSADQQIEEHIKQMKINQEIAYITGLLSTKSRNECGIK